MQIMAVLLCFLIYVVSCINVIDDERFHWGTYKPQLIHAVTERNTQTYNPLTVTFYYFMNHYVQWEKSIKYKVPEMNDFKQLYNYVAHDGETFAIHELYDDELQVSLRNEFYKLIPQKPTDWITTVSNLNGLNGDNEPISMVYSIALEALNPNIDDTRILSINVDGTSYRIDLSDQNGTIGYLYVSLVVEGQLVSLFDEDRFGFFIAKQNPQFNWNCRPLLFQELSQTYQDQLFPNQLTKPEDSTEVGTLIFVQYTGYRNQNFNFQVYYSTTLQQFSTNGYYYDYQNMRKLALLNFNKQFAATFFKEDNQGNPFFFECSKSAFSNLMGGFIAAYGDLYCETNEEPCDNPRMMFTTTPSRQGFPRPFLWDDGFHHLLSCKWNPLLCLQSLSDWMDTMTDDGWIPREQARGAELRSYFPQSESFNPFQRIQIPRQQKKKKSKSIGTVMKEALTKISAKQDDDKQDITVTNAVPETQDGSNPPTRLLQFGNHMLQANSQDDLVEITTSSEETSEDIDEYEPCRINPSLCLPTGGVNTMNQQQQNKWLPTGRGRAYGFRPNYNRNPGFQLKQQRHETNPPTFMFDFIYLHNKLQQMPQIKPHFEYLWPKIETWYDFWIDSQGVFNVHSEEKDQVYLFKWWGPNENSNFGSGMDDWPRTHPGYIGKYNIDASMWGWFFSDSMKTLSEIYDPEKTQYYKDFSQRIRSAINEHLLDNSDLIFKDLLIGIRGSTKDQLIFSPHIGYPNLLPLAFGFIDVNDTPLLEAYLNLLESPQLWSDYGIRSLSYDDNYFGMGDNYWRGPVWIPINYLIIRGLKKYYSNNEKAMTIYEKLRSNVIQTVCVNWRDSGFFYEHYNQHQDGKGNGHHPFSGWTSLITLIIAEIND